MRATLTRAGIPAAVCVALIVSTISAVSAGELSVYREFQLGNSVATVTGVTLSAGRDLKTIHSRPALLQQLEWRPRYMRGAPVPGRDSISEVVFGFVDDQLFKMTVTYERQRTNGLTNEDMIAAFTVLYGAPLSLSSQPLPRPGAEALDAAVVIAQWRDGDTQAVLQQNRYSDSFALVITSLSLDTIARTALETAVVMDAREAPAREAALAKKRADDERQAEEQVRAANKKVFSP
jgi:hypothetical protein